MPVSILASWPPFEITIPARRGVWAMTRWRAPALGLALILGTEGDGLSAATLAQTEFTVMIPMFSGVDSLNVAAASAVAFFATQPGHSSGL